MDFDTAPLAPRERAYLSCLAEGLTAKEVARANNVSPTTVEKAIRRVFNKLSAKNTANAVFKATCLGLLTGGDQPWQ